MVHPSVGFVTYSAVLVETRLLMTLGHYCTAQVLFAGAFWTPCGRNNMIEPAPAAQPHSSLQHAGAQVGKLL